MKVIFVCLGNICRSPMAEAMFRQMVQQAGLSQQVQIDSAGTSDITEGSAPHRQAQKTMRKHGLDPSGLIARPITDEDFTSADYIICMDQMNKEDLLAMAPVEDRHKVYRAYEIIPGKEDAVIDDPWYTHRFEDTYRSLAEVLPVWLNKIKKELH